MIEQINLYRDGEYVARCSCLSAADDFAEISSANVYTVVRNGKSELWGSSFINKEEIETNWVHTEEDGDIPRKDLKENQKFTKVNIN